MSEHIPTDDPTTNAVGRLRLLPSVTFGLNTAVLTRAALPVAMVAAGLLAGGPAAGAESLVVLDTTCCPPQA
ncbi:hypothetical protein BLA60_38860 [Actinophytocola xinjiangensis]|uniref:Uncharacterized protein n=1 Tax=Actinophytocola xinjiangensis TaxID=485602 RepID=A0A7Z0WE44_9PSEU|nr:hypothetical protein [Actinophytocola xinjiangensis]OLF04814.1 hypothetical protein BLA60_38860 [Actinophytocola xinjiangensis]